MRFKNVIWGVALTSSTLLALEPVPLHEAVPLTSTDELFVSPQWHPNSQKLAATRQHYTGLYLIDVPSGNSEEISNEYSAGYGFAWSHDGTRIACKVSIYDGMRRFHQIVSYDFEAGIREEWGPTKAMMTGVPRWTTNDAELFLTLSEKHQTFSLQQNSSQSQNHFFVEKGQLFKKETSRSNTQACSPEDKTIISYAVSPDENYIVYSTLGQKLWLTRSSDYETSYLGQGVAPSWAPDSQWIVYMLTEDDGHSMLNSDIYILNVNNPAPINLSNTNAKLEMNPQWSPDGNWIVYDTESQGQLFLQQMGWE